MEWDDLENALAWFKSAPGEWVDSGRKSLSAASEWIWEVIQGDFNEEQSTAQVVTGTVISMIPFVDQICDVRDVVANCKKIHGDTSNSWAWVALVLTLIGLFPTLGSLAKGCLKIVFAYGRKSVLRVSKASLDKGFWLASRPFVEAGIQKLNQHLQNPVVRRALKAARWSNPYKHLAKLVREIAGSLTVGKLLTAFDTIINALRDLMKMVKRWGTDSMGAQADALMAMVQSIRKSADKPLRKVLGPVDDWLNRLARRLEIESDMAYRASVNAHNPHKYMRPTLAHERMELAAAKPKWVDRAKKLKYRALDSAPTEKYWPDISARGAKRPTQGAFETFHSAEAVTIPPGEIIYRVVDPTSNDNSICWMRKAEFEALNSRDDWRRRFAVWRFWNRNGEYVIYKVPQGEGLRVWEGATASQRLETGSELVLEGGGKQIVLDPGHLLPENFGRRKPTGWGYTDFTGESDQFLGLPKLTNKIIQENAPTRKAI
ncbi:hypothetical protein INQ41_01350 [Lysobacter ciconiae]|uniref:Uncharacterized protein n=1 Tax=Novilysobacter ciconiae TaxID=2781022 RepID=A0A7S6UGA2_9GAMM|nr:hypothetical protein [Lysobacter ciconiae]QOW19752.1 hypothetical protein INQ41_01350 [Lysobacter ciconiae]